MFHKKFMSASVLLFAFLSTGISQAKPLVKADLHLIFAKFDIDGIGAKKVALIKSTVKHKLSIEADGDLILLTTRADVGSLKIPFLVLPGAADIDQLFVVKKAHDDLLANLEGDIIAKAGRSAVVQARTPYLGQLVWHDAIDKLTESIVLARQVANDTFDSQIVFTRDVSTIVDAVSGPRWHADLQKLSAINRYSRGTSIQQAQKYVQDTLTALPGFEVSTQPFPMGTTTAYNVIGKISGNSRPDEWIIVGAHYDSISQATSTGAPGAEDNGSGAAGMLELARVFSETTPETSILFIGFSGEEQGLKGSYAHVAKIISDGNKDKIKAVLNMDMIGYTRDADLDCLLESDQRGSALFPVLAAAAQQFTTLRMVTSLNPWGSDHVPYIENGIPSLLVIENDWNEYPAYHKTNDNIENITLAMGEQTLRMQAAVIAQMSGAASKK